jgi:hypothetical protein
VVVQPRQLHGTVGAEHRSRAEIDVGGEQLVDQRAEGVGFRQTGDLVAELEVVEDLLNVG